MTQCEDCDNPAEWEVYIAERGGMTWLCDFCRFCYEEREERNKREAGEQRKQQRW